MDKTSNKLARFSKQNIWTGFLFGVGIVAFLDEAIFHQLLHWHHFYDKSTTSIGLVSDGFFHAFSWFATVGGLFLFADLRRRNAVRPKVWCGGILLGAGTFQLYDGLIQHKIMRIHQIRYVENIFLYDFIWNLAAVILMLASIFLIIRSRRVFRKGGSHNE